MTVQYSDAVRDAKNDQVETTIGTSPKLQLRSGAQPANCAAADSGTLLAEMTLPSDWMANSSGGVKSKSGTWSTTGSAAGTIAHYRIKNSGGTTTHEQGSVTLTGGGGDMTVDNTNIGVGQTVTVSSYSKTSGNP
jgi:hypothetical protein